MMKRRMIRRRFNTSTLRFRGISLVEVTVSTAIVGLIVVGAMKCLATSTQTAESTADHTLGMLLAEDLMEEILQLDYVDPDETAVFGPENSEATTSRVDWDDVDDFDNWAASPPVDQDGVAVADSSWKRIVTVHHIDAALENEAPDSTDTGVKIITVTVLHHGVSVATLTGIQTKAWISTIPNFAQANTTGQLPPVNEPPTAAISSHLNLGLGTVSVDFDGTGSTDPESAPLEYSWDFGNGGTSEESEPTAVFSNPGSGTLVFNITLVVKDIHGAEDETTSTVTVYPNL